MDRTAPRNIFENCSGVGDVLSRVGDKWTVQVVVVLHQEPRRFNALKKLVPGISQQMLTRTLKALERDGLVKRTVHDTTPPQVEYSLTQLGLSLSKPVRHLAEWAIEHRMVIGRYRRDFDRR
ncbi:winged helix-turn-helix transcriptional regulator [Rhizobium wenxiniae]|uniref:winged helix-turn-helix transcriptional regulator n=1 Tax=Rhizobium wenxiniae TaxID=1737357 RepID=UPI003C1D0A2E